MSEFQWDELFYIMTAKGILRNTLVAVWSLGSQTQCLETMTYDRQGIIMLLSRQD